MEMPSLALSKFAVRAKEALELSERPVSDHVNYKSSVVLLAAAWEIYIEILILESAEFIASNARNESVLPDDIKRRVAQMNLTSDGRQKHDLFPWHFTGDNWRQQFLKYVTRQIDNFHSPMATNLRDLFAKTLGIANISEAWGRTGMSAQRAADTLDGWLNMRHSIAHGIREDPFIRRDVQRFFKFISITVRLTQTAVERTLELAATELPLQ